MTKNKIASDLTDNLAFLIHHAALDYETHFDRHMQELKLTRSQWLLLAHLNFYDGITQRGLSDLMGIGKAATGRLTHKLEQAGWLSRVPDPTDGRAMNVYLTDSARPIVENLSGLLIMETERSLDGFSPEDIDRFRADINRIRRNIVSVPTSAEWNKLREKTLALCRQAGL